MLNPLRARSRRPCYAIIRGGYLAVTTFFVLSGFVLARSYSATVWSPRSILRYSARPHRPRLPGLSCSLAGRGAFHPCRPDTRQRPAFSRCMDCCCKDGSATSPVQWNTPAWSLSCEMFFYLSFPLAAAWMQGAGWRRTVCAAIAGLRPDSCRCGPPASRDGIKPLIHLADFLMGIAASCAYDLLRSARRRPAGAWLYLPGLAASAAIIAWPALLPAGVDLNSALRPLNGLLLVGLALGGGAIARALSTTRGRVPRQGELRDVHPARAAAVVVSAMDAGSLGRRLSRRRDRHLGGWSIAWIEEPANRYLRSRIQVALQS